MHYNSNSLYFTYNSEIVNSLEKIIYQQPKLISLNFAGNNLTKNEEFLLTKQILVYLRYHLNLVLYQNILSLQKCYNKFRIIL